VQLLGAVLILALLVRELGAGPFLHGLRGLRPGSLLAAAAICAVTTICSAWRWRVVAGALGAGLPIPAAVAAYYRSQFLNSVLPGGVLGDVHRGLRHGLDAGDLGRGLRAVAWERFGGQAVQAVVALAVLLTLPSPVHGSLPAVAGLGVVAAGALLVGGRAAVRHGPARVAASLRAAAAEARDALLQPSTLPSVVCASLVVVAGHLGTFLLATRAAGVQVPMRELLPVALLVLLAAAIPLNIAGWGPREGVAAWIFANAGWGAAAGTAAATAFGVLTLGAVLPGAVVLLAGWRRARPPAFRPAGVRRDRAIPLVSSGGSGATG
jgi:uncharacterized membrane protein YbhN (UPF0104 family)